MSSDNTTGIPWPRLHRWAARADPRTANAWLDGLAANLRHTDPDAHGRLLDLRRRRPLPAGATAEQVRGYAAALEAAEREPVASPVPSESQTEAERRLPKVPEPPAPLGDFTTRTLAAIAKLPWPVRGRQLWTAMHYAANPSRKLIDVVTPLVGRKGCGCRKHWLAWLRDNPPDYGDGWREWVYRAHQSANARRGVPGITWAECQHRHAIADARRAAFDRVVCINLDRRPERYARLMDNVVRIDGGWPFAPIQRLPAVDGHAMDVPAAWKRINGGVGAYGCSLSHRAALRQAVTNGVRSILIMEDDVLFRPDFSDRACEFMAAVEAFDPTWEMLMFGGQPLNGWKSKVMAPGVARSTGTNRFHCYAVRGPLIADLLARLERSTGHCDIEPWDLLRNRKVYEPDPHYIAAQAAGQSDIGGGDLTIRPWHKADVAERTILLHAPRDAMESLASDGWHFGQHRDGDTGIDVWLKDLPGKHKTPDALATAVRSFAKGIKAEAHAVGAVAAIWHPTIDPDTLCKGMPDPWTEVFATTVAEAEAGAGIVRRAVDTSCPPVPVRKLVPGSPDFPRPDDNPRRTLVLAPAFGYDSDLPECVRQMLDSAAVHGVVVTLIGTDKPFRGLYDAKVVQMWAATRELTGFDHVMMIDATDVLWAAGLDELFDRFDEAAADFVCAGEANVFPEQSADVPHADQRFHGLNSGCYLATRAGFQRVMGAVAAVPDDGRGGHAGTHANDQATFWVAYLSGAGITVDHECKLFQCLYGLGMGDFDWGERPINRTTWTRPIVWHGNGTSKDLLPAVRREMGLQT